MTLCGIFYICISLGRMLNEEEEKKNTGESKALLSFVLSLGIKLT